jgi:hypothetical protein
MVAHFEWPDISSLATLYFANFVLSRHPDPEQREGEGPLYLSLFIARLTEPVSRKPQPIASLTQRTILARAARINALTGAPS